MKKFIFSLLLLAFLFSCDDDDNENLETGVFAVANRGAGTVTIYNASTQELINTITLPQGSAPAYVVESPETGYLYISDFSQQKVWVYDSSDFSMVTDYPIQEGGFHMWVNDVVDQLWVNNIVSKTTTVISTNTGNVLATIPLEATGITFGDSDAQHDVFIAPNGEYAYVSIFSPNGQNYVLQYDTQNFDFVRSVEVGGDPHLSGSSNQFYILSQVESSISEYSYTDLSPTGNTASIMNAHGVINGGGNQFYVTNISGRQVVSYNAGSNTILDSEPTIASAGVAHNLAYSPESNVVALTISGGSTVEFFDVSDNNNISVLSSSESGANPFGIWYYTADLN